MMSMTTRIDNFTHASEGVVGPDGFSRPLKIIMGIERRSRVVVYAFERFLLTLGAMELWSGVLSLAS